MTAALPDSQSIAALAEKKDVIAIGPGLGADPPLVSLTRSLFAESDKPMVIDADGLNALVGQVPDLPSSGKLRVLTPHPGEMARLIGRPVTERVAEARALATEKHVVLVLKGEAHPYRLSGRQCLDQPDRHARHGNRRYRRHSDRDGSLLPRTVPDSAGASYRGCRIPARPVGRAGRGHPKAKKSLIAHRPAGFPARGHSSLCKPI